MKEKTNSPKSQKHFREANRCGFYGTLSKRLSAMDTTFSFVNSKNRRIFCGKTRDRSKNLLQNVIIKELEAGYFHV